MSLILNDNNRKALAFARHLGGEPFVAFMVQVTAPSMVEYVLPEFQRSGMPAPMMQVVDAAFVCGLFEAWKRLRP